MLWIMTGSKFKSANVALVRAGICRIIVPDDKNLVYFLLLL